MTTISRTRLQHQSCLNPLFIWLYNANRFSTSIGTKNLHTHRIVRKKYGNMTKIDWWCWCLLEFLGRMKIKILQDTFLSSCHQLLQLNGGNTLRRPAHHQSENLYHMDSVINPEQHHSIGILLFEPIKGLNKFGDLFQHSVEIKMKLERQSTEWLFGTVLSLE